MRKPPPGRPPAPKSANRVFARQLRAPRARVCGCHQAFEWAIAHNRLSQPSTTPNAPVRLRMADLALAPRERQTCSSHRILHGFQLGHFVPMYGYCFQVVCIRACGNTVLAWQSLTFSRLSSAFGKSPRRCHRYFIGSYNDRAKQGVREMVGTEAAEAAF